MYTLYTFRQAHSIPTYKLIKYLIIILLISFNGYGFIPKHGTDKYLPPPKYQVLSFSSSKAEIKEAIAEEFGEEMVKIVNCESGFNPKAVNINKDSRKTKDFGIFQLNNYYQKKLAESMGIDINNMSIQEQFEITKEIVNKNGYEPWVCHKKISHVK